MDLGEFVWATCISHNYVASLQKPIKSLNMNHTPREKSKSAPVQPSLEGGEQQGRSMSAPAFSLNASSRQGGGEGAELENMGGDPVNSPTTETPVKSETPVETGGEKDTAKPTLKFTTVNGPTSGKNGQFRWGAQWSLNGATDKTNGWIVQKLTIKQDVKDDKGAVVTPGKAPWGGFAADKTPYWEGWQVRNGKIYIGSSNSLHGADTYSQGPVGDKTVGRTDEIGDADFYPDLTLPDSFAQRENHPGGSLPIALSDPSLSGGTGAVDHSLNATWDSVKGNGDTTVKTT
jgi:hypothetical protein